MNLALNQMQNKQHVKLQLRAVSLVLDFCRELVECQEGDEGAGVFPPYAEPVLTCLMTLFNQALQQNTFAL